MKNRSSKEFKTLRKAYNPCKKKWTDNELVFIFR